MGVKNLGLREKRRREASKEDLVTPKEKAEFGLIPLIGISRTLDENKGTF